MTLAQEAAAAADADFRDRIIMSTVRAAASVGGEDYVTAGYSQRKADKRSALSVKVLSGDRSILNSFVRAVSADAGGVADPSTVTDAAIDTSVDSTWDDIAGVMFGE